LAFLPRLAIAGIFVGFNMLFFSKAAASNVEAGLKPTSAMSQYKRILVAVALPLWSAWCRNLQMRASLSD
jgi:hypothetical protein